MEDLIGDIGVKYVEKVSGIILKLSLGNLIWCLVQDFRISLFWNRTNDAIPVKNPFPAITVTKALHKKQLFKSMRYIKIFIVTDKSILKHIF